MKVVKVRTYVHKARGTSRASRAMAPPLFLPNLKNTWSIRACRAAIANGGIL